MSIEKNIDRIIRIDQLIRLNATGNPNQLASKLLMSERNLFKIINCMKNIGAPIKYCNSLNSYIYTKDVELKIFSKKNSH